MLASTKLTGRPTRIYTIDFEVALNFISYSTFSFSSSWNAFPPSAVPANEEGPVVVPLEKTLCVNNNHGYVGCSHDGRHRGYPQVSLVHMVGSSQIAGN